MSDNDKYVYGIKPEDLKYILKNIRAHMKMTQSEVADKMNITLRRYQRFENVEGLMHRNQVELFAKIMGLTYDEVLKGGGVVRRNLRFNYIEGLVADEEAEKLHEPAPKYFDDSDEDIVEIVKLLKSDKVLRKLMVKLLRHVANLRD